MPIKGVRKTTAAAMVQSAFTAPHVTEFLTIDVTPMMEFREKLKKPPEFAGVQVTPLTFAAKAVCLAAKRTPDVNADWDEQARRDRLQGLCRPRDRGGDAARPDRAEGPRRQTRCR